MASAHAIRLQIEAALAHRIPSALTPAPRATAPVATTGIAEVDKLLHGGLPLGEITEIAGEECSGRSSLALSFVAQRTSEGKVCAWIDVSNALRPESAAAAGVDLTRLLWVRCGIAAGAAAAGATAWFELPKACLDVPAATKGLYAGGWGAHPRSEVKGLSDVTGRLLRAEVESPATLALPIRAAIPDSRIQTTPPTKFGAHNREPQRLWARLDQALRVADLLLQSGGFGAIVLDLGGAPPEGSSRIPLATWFRYRAAAERSQASVLLLTQHLCAKSSAGLLLRMRSTDTWHDEDTVMTGLEFNIEIERQRFAQTSNVVPMRKGPQRETAAQWSNRCSWAGRR